MRVREDHAAMDQEPRLVAEALLPLLMALAVIVVHLGRGGFLLVIIGERGENAGADRVAALRIGDAHRLALDFHPGEIVPRGLAGEADRQPLDRDMAVAVIMI